MSAPVPVSDPGRILIIKPSAIGDVVHTLPFLNLLRRRYPKAHIAWLVTPACAGLIDGHPQLDEVILFDRRQYGLAWRHPLAALNFVGFLRRLRRERFDLVIDLQGLFRSAFFAFETRAPVRVGFSNAREFAPAFYTHRVPVHTMEQHAIERYLAVAEAIDCGRSPVEFHFPTKDEDRARVRELLTANRDPHVANGYAVLLPGTNWPTKRWPAGHFAALVPILRERFHLPTIVAGSPSEVELCSQIPAELDLTGKTTLRQLVALLEGAALVIANDSGPMHIAAALGRPLVTLFGPTNPTRTGPYDRPETVLRLDIPCSPCYSRRCSHQSCLQWLTPEHVLTHVRQQLPRNPLIP